MTTQDERISQVKEQARNRVQTGLQYARLAIERQVRIRSRVNELDQRLAVLQQELSRLIQHQ